MKTIDYTLADFQASMSASYPPKRLLSSWEQMCEKATEAQRVYPEGHWPKEFERIYRDEQENKRLASDRDHHGLFFVPETSTKEVLITDVETGEQVWMEVETETNPSLVGIDNNDMAARWIKDTLDFELIRVSLRSAGTMRYINDTLRHMEKHCSSHVHKLVDEAHLVIAAIRRISKLSNGVAA